MGRLEDVIARHEARKKLTARQVTLAAIFVVFIGTIVLMMFTDLGTPNVDRSATPTTAPAPDAAPTHADRVDDVRLLTPPHRAAR